MNSICMRDKLCDKDVLQEIIEVQKEYLEEDKQELSFLKSEMETKVGGSNEKAKKTIVFIRRNILKMYRDQIRAMYSLGCSCEEVEEVYREMLPFIGEAEFDDIGYVNMLHYISLGILFDIPSEEMQGFVDVIDKAEVDDIIMDYFLKVYGLKRNMISTNYQEERPYKELMEIVENSLKDRTLASAMLETYMKEKWLKGHAAYGWPNLHKDLRGYYGIWSFDAAAITKILQIDDDTLKEDNHYPYDLAHYKKGKIYNPSVSIHNKDGKANNSYPDHIVDNPLIENVIPQTFYSCVNQLVEDYYGLQDEEFWLKYNLKNVWFELDDYIEEKKSGLLGMLIVFSLTEAGYITQIDYKEEIDDYRESIKNYWDIEDTQIIEFILNNDQVYLARIPSDHNLCALYEVEVRKIS